MTTSRDIARIAGVSQSTVSRVLNGSTKVSPETKLRVMEALGEYRPNAQARAMRRNRTDIIGVVASQITNPYFPELLEELSRAAARRGMRVILWNDTDPDAEAAVEGALAGFVDGICYTSALMGSSGVRRLAETGIPLVLVNRGLPGVAVDQVTSDSDAAGRIAAQYLLKAGRTMIATAFGPNENIPMRDRARGFLEELSLAGVTIPTTRHTQGEMTFTGGYEAVNHMIGEGVAFDALFCGNDVMAFGALSALQDHGRQVPDDVWVIGHDDLPMASWPPFKLTSIRQPIAAMADQAVELLLDRLSGKKGPTESRRLAVSLVPRASTADTPA